MTCVRRVERLVAHWQQKSAARELRSTFQLAARQRIVLLGISVDFIHVKHVHACALLEAFGRCRHASQYFVRLQLFGGHVRRISWRLCLRFTLKILI